MESSLCIIKPDAIDRKIVGKIYTMIEDKNIEFVSCKMIRLNPHQVSELYGEHAKKFFFKDLVKYMTSGPVILQILQGINIVSRYKDLVGNTNPLLAETYTIRRKFGKNITMNTVHGSDSLHSAEKEINIFADVLL